MHCNKLKKTLDFWVLKEHDIITLNRGEQRRIDCKRQKEDMTRLEILTLLLSIKALLDSDNIDKAKELIDEVIAEAKRTSSDD